MTRLFLIGIFATCLAIDAPAQYFDVGVMGGIAKYRGDLTPKNGDIELRPSFGVFFRYHFTPRFAFKVNITGGSFSGDDQNATDELVRLRNLRFRASFTEFGFVGECNLLKFLPQDKKHGITPYAQLGMAFLYFNPKAKFEDRWYPLHALSTEGQGTDAYPNKKKYSLLQIVFPMGVGFRYALSPKANIGFEFAWRLTLTDYLDDVSGDYVEASALEEEIGPVAAALSNRTGEYLGTPPLDLVGTPRGNPKNKDSYMIFGLTFSMNFYESFPFTEKRRVKKRDDTDIWF